MRWRMTVVLVAMAAAGCTPGDASPKEFASNDVGARTDPGHSMLPGGGPDFGDLGIRRGQPFTDDLAIVRPAPDTFYGDDGIWRGPFPP